MSSLYNPGMQGLIRQKSILFVLALLTAVSAGIPAKASPLNKEIVFAYPPHGYPPYIIAPESGDNVRGIVIDIFQAVAKEVGHEVTYRQYPDKRAKVLMARGQVDAMALAPEWIETPDNYEWTAPVLKVADHLIFGSGRVIKNATIESLRDRMVGTMVAFHYPSFDKSFQNRTIKRIDAPAFRNLFKLLSSGRVDAILLDERVAAWYIAQSDDLHPGDFAIRRPGFDPVGYRIMMPRLQPLGWEGFIEDYNKKLKEWKSDGRVEATVSRYGVHLKQAFR